jgi:hypothetical protein
VGVPEELRERRGEGKKERGKKLAIRTGIKGLIKYQHSNACSFFTHLSPLLFPLSSLLSPLSSFPFC